MKKLLLLLFLIPNLVMAETWHCSYKSTEGPAEDTESFKREGKFFVSEGKFGDYKNKYLIANETDYSIILAFQSSVSDYVIRLIKVRKIEGSINYIDLTDMSQWKGSCILNW